MALMEKLLKGKSFAFRFAIVLLTLRLSRRLIKKSNSPEFFLTISHVRSRSKKP
jgi:hypothetical protein